MRTFLLLLIILAGCEFQTSPPDLQFARNELWSHERGFKIGKGRMVDCYENYDSNNCKNQPYSLRNDTIFYYCEPSAAVIRTDKKSGKMVVRNVISKEVGVYINNPGVKRL